MDLNCTFKLWVGPRFFILKTKSLKPCYISSMTDYELKALLATLKDSYNLIIISEFSDTELKAFQNQVLDSILKSSNIVLSYMIKECADENSS